METVVIVAIGVLATIFLASFVALVVVCRHRYCHPHDLLHHFDSKSVTLSTAKPKASDISVWDVVNSGSSAVFSDPRWILLEPWRPRVSHQSWSWTMWSSPTPTLRPSWRMRTGSRMPRRLFRSFFPLLRCHLV